MRKEKVAITGPRAASIVGSIFRVRRDLVGLIKKSVIDGTGLTLEQTDLLLDIYGAGDLGWPDPQAFEDGWVTFAALKKSLVHAPELLTRRMEDLKRKEYVEVAPMDSEEAKRAGVDRKTKKVRVLPKGRDKGKLIYDRYCRCSEQLVRDIDPADLETVLRVNETLMSKLRWRV